MGAWARLLDEFIGVQVYRGFSLDFDGAGCANQSASCFTFSDYGGKLRLHSKRYNNNMLFFLGIHAPREWVVWEDAHCIKGKWEILDLVWLDGGETFKIKYGGPQYVKWVVSGFVGVRSEGEATKFILRKA